MKRVKSRTWIQAHGIAIALLVLGGCNLLGGPSKVKAGELFETGDARYDAYFKEVHELQVAAAGWGDERRSSCQSLIDNLKLPPDAEALSVVRETSDRIASASREVGPTKLEITGEDVHLTAANASRVDELTRELFKSIEICAHTENQRVKALRGIPARAEELTKTGHQLEPQIRETFAKRGGRAGLDVQSELGISFDILETIGQEARASARSSEDFVANLQRAVGTDGTGSAPRNDERVASKSQAKSADEGSSEDEPSAEPVREKPRPRARPAPAARPRATAKPAAAPAARPKPVAKKKPASDEVFNP